MELHPFSPCPVDSPDKCPLESRPVMDIAVSLLLAGTATLPVMSYLVPQSFDRLTNSSYLEQLFNSLRLMTNDVSSPENCSQLLCVDV